MKNISVYAFSDEASPDIDCQIKALKRNNLAGMEIRNVDGINVSQITKEKAREVKAKLDDEGLSVWSVGSPIGKIGIKDDFEPHLETFKHTLEIANILNAKNMRIFSFFVPRGDVAEEYEPEVLERLDRFLDVSRPSGVTLCHENEKEIYGDIPERCLRIHKSLPEIKGVFDPANFVQCSVDTLKAWELLKQNISYVHIKDSTADGLVVPSGHGVGQVSVIAKDYIGLGGKAFTIEPHLAIFGGSEKLERGKTIKSSFGFADNDTAFDAACQSFRKILQVVE